MFDFEIDLRGFERKARDFGAAQDQVRFSLAYSLTGATSSTLKRLIAETWPKHVEVRNRGFLRQALRVERATKANLASAITTAGTRAGARGNLALHAGGGIRRAKKRLAIPPTGSVRRTSGGVAAAQKPRTVIDRTPKRALRVTSRGIFVGEGGRLRLKYTFRPVARIKPDVPFRQDFARYMSDELRRELPKAVAKAMKTRRR